MRRAAIVGSVAAAFLTCVILIMAIYIPSPSVAPSESTQMNWLHKVAVAETDGTKASTKDETKATSTKETIAKIGKPTTTTTAGTTTTTTTTTAGTTTTTTTTAGTTTTTTTTAGTTTTTTTAGTTTAKDETTAQPTAVDFLITELRWAANGPGGNASLTVCSNSTLSETGQLNTIVKLSCNGTGIDSTDAIFGDVDADDDNCAIFRVDFRLPSSPTTYTVDVGFLHGTQKVGTVTVAVTVEMAILQCGESIYTKLSWTEPTELNQTCIADLATLSKACYSEGDLTDTNFCFAVEGGDTNGQPYNLTVCLKKPFANVANESTNGSFAVNYVFYGDSHGIEPSLSLIYNGLVTAVIVSSDDSQEDVVYGCNDTVCSVPGLVPAVAQYRVCGEVVVGEGDASTMQTATTDFTDLDLILLPDNAQGRGSVLHFVFANALPEKVYRATVYSALPPGTYNNHSSVEVDCSLVHENHACFGFLSIEGLTGTVYLAVSREGGDSNKVVSPHDAGVTTTTVAPQMMTMAQQQGSEQM